MFLKGQNQALLNLAETQAYVERGGSCCTKSVATLSERRVAQIKQLSGHYLWTPLMKKKYAFSIN